MISRVLLPLLGLVLVLAGCGDDDAGGASSVGAGGSLQAGAGQGGQPGAGAGGVQAGVGGAGAGGAGQGGAGEGGAGEGGAGAGGAGASDAGTGGAGGAGEGGSGQGGAGAGGAGAGGVPEAKESEPNGGATKDEFNALPAGVKMKGTIGEKGDADLFRLEAKPGKVYVASLTLPAGSSLQGHLAVFDAGRGGKAAGEDYVKIGLSRAAGEGKLEWLAMGEGGYFLAVRDERNVGEDVGVVGGEGFDYELTVSELEVDGFVQGGLQIPGKNAGAFASAGSLHLYAFEVPSGGTLSVDFTPGGASLDGRFFAFSKATLDWMARNDNRDVSDPSPLFEQVPLSPGGGAFLVVENADPEATTLSYSLASGTPLSFAKTWREVAGAAGLVLGRSPSRGHERHDPIYERA